MHYQLKLTWSGFDAPYLDNFMIRFRRSDAAVTVCQTDAR